MERGTSNKIALDWSWGENFQLDHGFLKWKEYTGEDRVKYIKAI